jgi:hypothetical protein
VEQKIAEIDAEIAKQQNLLLQHQAIMKAESGGAELPGASGKAGFGPKAKAAEILADQDQAAITNLKSQRAVLEKSMRGARQRDQEMAQAADSRTSTLKETGDDIQRDLAQTTTELRALEGARSRVFAEYDRKAVEDPAYKPRQNGMFNRMSALQDYEQDPENGLATRGLLASVTAVVFCMELAAVLWALSRRSTKSEKEDAMIDTHHEYVIEREIAQHLWSAAPIRLGVRQRMLALDHQPTIDGNG